MAQDIRTYYVTRNPDIASSESDGESVILNFRSGEFVKLNATASSVWRLCNGGCRIQEIVSEFAVAHAMDEETAFQNVLSIFEEFARSELVNFWPAIPPEDDVNHS